MSTLRVFYPMVGLAVSTGAITTNFTSGNSGVNTLGQLQRLQNFTYNFTNNRTIVEEYGQFNALGRIITSPPNVTADLSYYVADLANEQTLGFYISGDQSCLTNILNGSTDEHNFYLVQGPYGTDLIGYTGQSQVTQLTNMVLSTWSTEGRIGGIPTTTCNFQGMNFANNTGSINQNSVAIIKASGVEVSGVLFSAPLFTTGNVGSYPALRPIDIQLNLNNPGIGYASSTLNPQSYNISFSLNRQSLHQIGDYFPYAIVVVPPIILDATFEFNYGDFTTGDLAGLLCNDPTYTFQLNLFDPGCPAFSNTLAAQYTVVGAQLDTQSINTAIGNVASTITMKFSVVVGQGASTNAGLFMSGVV